MPIKSARQYRLMQAAAHGGSKMHVSKSVALEMIHKTPKAKRSAFAKASPAKRSATRRKRKKR